MKFHLWDIGQLLFAGVALTGILIEIQFKAHIGYICFSLGCLGGFLIEKFRPRKENVIAITSEKQLERLCPVRVAWKKRRIITKPKEE